MKNLDEFGVQEMDTKEMKKTDGGFIFELLLGVAAGYGLYHLGKKVLTDEW